MAIALIIFSILCVLISIITLALVIVFSKKEAKIDDNKLKNLLELILANKKTDFASELVTKNADFEKHLTSNLEEHIKVYAGDVETTLQKHLFGEEKTSFLSVLKRDFDILKKSIEDEKNKVNAELNTLKTEQTAFLNNFHLKRTQDNNQLTSLVTTKMTEIQQNTTDKLKEIELYVKSKLQQELSTAIKTEFQNAKDAVERLQQNVQVIQDVNQHILQLHSIFSNNKKIGLAGEFILEDMLADRYGNKEVDGLLKFQHTIKDDKIVDATIKLYTNNSQNKFIYLPIDSKFPYTTFNNYLVEEKDKSKAEEALLLSIRKKFEEAASYVIDGVTTSHVLMFLPSETLYYFLITHKKFLDLKKEFPNVIPVSPSTIICFIDMYRAMNQYSALTQNLNVLFGSLKKLMSHVAAISTGLTDSRKKQIDSYNALVKVAKEFTNATVGIENFLNTTGFSADSLEPLEAAQKIFNDEYKNKAIEASFESGEAISRTYKK
ncbi:DNA recombination protein RmuC [Mycoplasmopsis columbinasalis]|uniref:RmuC family n=1 Tax=Mycoplasmopsis columbinasalis TaxID=114880 RepID=A0A449BAF7_9BACT|nr:DNA recombination protein RmuC [Mycoplasmopsis columbinasalis]VEU78168.1 RmuC family [Mycoplasmopsis columbinasalis]